MDRIKQSVERTTFCLVSARGKDKEEQTVKWPSIRLAIARGKFNLGKILKEDVNFLF